MNSGNLLVLRNNERDDLTLTRNGAFEFATKVEAGKTYSVSIATQPQGQTCTVSQGAGTANAVVSNLQVQCVDDTPNPDTSAACFASDKPFTKGSIWTYTTATGKTTHEAGGETDFRGTKAYSVVTIRGDGNSVTHFNHVGGVRYVFGIAAGGRNIVSSTQTIFTPPITVPLALPLNQPHASSYTATTGSGSSVLSTSKQVQTATYMGRETVTTAFGTFRTCKMEYRVDVSGPAPTSVGRLEWVIASGKFTGLIAQSQADGKTTQPTNIEVNWN